MHRPAGLLSSVAAQGGVLGHVLCDLECSLEPGYHALIDVFSLRLLSRGCTVLHGPRSLVVASTACPSPRPVGRAVASSRMT